mmetsp:Transcript_25382/g.82097  ORF Transcript_25382/g.82097 Transcript_25382/m.82097 type:complete len:400 (+) Transcript_25382:479-1678(+)
MGALDGLHLYRRVPPWLEEEDVCGFLEVEALAAGLEGEEDDGDGGVGLEAVEDGLALGEGHVAHELDDAEAGEAEAPLDDVEHVAILGEDDGLGAGVRLAGVDDGVEDGLDLGGRVPLGEVDLLEDGFAAEARPARGAVDGGDLADRFPAEGAVVVAELLQFADARQADAHVAAVVEHRVPGGVHADDADVLLGGLGALLRRRRVLLFGVIGAAVVVVAGGGRRRGVVVDEEKGFVAFLVVDPGVVLVLVEVLRDLQGRHVRHPAALDAQGLEALVDRLLRLLRRLLGRRRRRRFFGLWRQRLLLLFPLCAALEFVVDVVEVVVDEAPKAVDLDGQRGVADGAFGLLAGGGGVVGEFRGAVAVEGVSAGGDDGFGRVADLEVTAGAHVVEARGGGEVRL